MLSFLLLALSIAVPFAEAKPHTHVLKRTCPSKSSGSSSSSGSSKSSKAAVGWYAGYHSTDFPLSDVSWSKYTHLTFSFAVTTPDVNTLSLEDSDAPLLPQFVETAHKNNVKALVSIGGWTGSKFYSNNVATQANRTAFVKTVTGLATKYNLDGIDFDWEYPGAPGLECNAVSADDTANYLSFLQELRADPVGKKLILTAAVSISPWADATKTPSKDVSAFAKVLDWVAIMNYDVWGSWSNGVGPNAPLNDTCATPARQQGSAVSAVKAWTEAGFPTSQIVLGVAAYGHSFHVDQSAALSGNTLNAYPAFVANEQPAGDKWDGAAGTDDGCGVLTQQPGGVMTFWGMIDANYLNSNGTVASGIDYRFDDCSQTPYVYNPKTEVMISFDDAHSFASKGQFIKSQNLRGFSMWEAGGDSNDILLSSIRSAAGYP